ncbi:CPBP family intramembrane glutamic endopeptidase [Paenibacillus sp. D2_2]|uniref:CPBP family intramembrane glutamic endopeptidase n=1 Tax=Paenibacillus sp. D2_2 TaxID=3073092 RepID=UPI002815D7DB|nr:CPBP family intramembrane glutamic endopeptidase [Paenibacillus sp. D2_2]WMT42879.1 CPBP family intramembrane glutamic endopeptidase [Paenibacillus sp. D2_2]
MEEKQRKEHPILFSFMLGIGLTLLVAVASAVATILESDDRGIVIAQGIAFFVMAVIITIYMKKRDASLGIFGFTRTNLHKAKAVLYYLPLLVIVVVQPIIGGFNTSLSVTDIVLILLFSLLVGYTEESIFRGIIRERLRPKGSVFFIVFSALFFGILHMANAFNGSGFLHIFLQVLNALLIGFILALIIEIEHSIIPLILFHFLFDALAQLTSSSIIDKEVLAVSILNILYLLYGIYLIYVMLRSKRASLHPNEQISH